MSYKETIDELLTNSATALTNAAENADVASALESFGYNAEKINEGKTLLETAADLHAKQKKEYSEQYKATDEFYNQRTIANKEYMKLVKLSRLCFKEKPGIYSELGLGGRRKVSISGWITQVDQFYRNLLSNTEAKEVLALFGITEEKIQAAYDLLKETQTLLSIKNNEMGEAQEATKERDKAIDELDKWMDDFYTVAHIALEENPQLIEVLGVVEPS
ncbi:MAG: hypothetical protein PVH88_15655 [Ignavibacteria bacterium]|jgi:hypothetical protein